MTDPIPRKIDWLKACFWRLVRFNFLKPVKLGGHFAVTRSLLSGLKKIGYRFNYNPKFYVQISDTVAVLSSLEALRQAINLKRSGRIKRLIAGPNLVVMPSDANDLITAPEIDLYLVNSNWTQKCYLEDAPSLKGRCEIWPAGVDEMYWIPKKLNSGKQNKKILFYQKTSLNELFSDCLKYVQSKGYEVGVIEYGHYDRPEFLDALCNSELSVFFSQHESQGLALAEAWSVNVPTLVFNPQIAILYPGTEKEKRVVASSAPYLSSATGLNFSDYTGFVRAFHCWEKDKDNFSPRSWVLEHMTDEVCTRQFIKYL
jgi:hypothetical protein